ncbi:hypothetical protein RKD23_006721 [Streptomyces sp. SAI-170]|jgi:hypothetical protein
MPENTNPEPTENEDIEVVAHGETEEVVDSGCVINNSSELS